MESRNLPKPVINFWRKVFAEVNGVPSSIKKEIEKLRAWLKSQELNLSDHDERILRLEEEVRELKHRRLK